MTSTPAAPPPQPGSARTLHLSDLLRRPLTDRGGESIGRLSDVIVRLRGAESLRLNPDLDQKWLPGMVENWGKNLDECDVCLSGVIDECVRASH